MKKKKKRALTGELMAHPYKQRIILMRANTFEELLDIWEECPIEKNDLNRDIKWMEESFRKSKSFVTEFSDDQYLDLVFVCKLGRGDVPGTIAHEAYHIMNRIYQEIGYSHDLENDEASAYFLTYLVDNLTNFLDED